ncbi:L-alanine-DL-glutamate epimerase [Haloechinothrix alba]|uniref:L-alanine-DL-glutamate epimerase n=1 Tax=Haloechinothrix alba TaxID=664784 RepID=A0A238YTY2_9PSEU|nr:ATP-grasp fold amidoligase family protein [Haloechinothrix alba]SNR74412.1 L-alanine-DL-glutamate epimerase [Haloechinothrix alba]
MEPSRSSTRADSRVRGMLPSLRSARGRLRRSRSRLAASGPAGGAGDLRLDRVTALHYDIPHQVSRDPAVRGTTPGSNFLVTITADRGGRLVEGTGECLPEHAYAGDGDEGGDAAWAFVRAASRLLYRRTLTFRDRSEALTAVRGVMAELGRLAVDHTGTGQHDRPLRGTLFGIEVALLDTAARALDLQVSELLGSRREQVGISGSRIPFGGTPDDAAERAIRQRRYPVTRLQGSGVVEQDWTLLETVSRANRSADTDRPIWLELREPLDATGAAGFVDGVTARMISGELPASVLIQGLLQADQLAALPGLQRRADEALLQAPHGPDLDLRVVAGERVEDASDLELLNAHGGCRALTIRPDRVGGLLATVELADAALAADPGIHIGIAGVTGASDVSAWALHNLARSLPRMDYLTIPPRTSAEVRITDPPVRFHARGSNILAPQGSPGLGAAPVLATLEPYVERSFDANGQGGLEVARQPTTSGGRIDAVHATRERLDRLTVEELERQLEPRLLATADDDHRARVRSLLRVTEPRHLTHAMVRRLERNDMSLPSGLSFRSLMLEQSEARRLGVFRPGWLLDNKAKAYAFVDEVGVRRPRCDRVARPFAAIEPAAPMVIKPVRSTGSKGTYLVYSPDHIIHLRDGMELSSWDAMAEHAFRLMSHEHRPVPDRWMTEELILEDSATRRTATDLKFYAFYGNVLLIRESRRVSGGKQGVRYWTRDNEPARTGVTRGEHLDEARGTNPEQLELVESLSREIPVPFMRIDMLRGEDGLVLGEFTPRPGAFELFDETWDRRMAESWVLAEGRIIDDVLGGKDFAAFAKATR